MVARETWHQHPDQLAGAPFTDQMMIDMMALALIEQEELKEAQKS